MSSDDTRRTAATAGDRSLSVRLTRLVAGVRRRPWVVLAGVALALGLALIVVPGDGEDRSVLATEQSGLATEADPEAVAFLRQAADELEADNTEPVQMPRRDQWLYQETGSADLASVEIDQTNESWWSFADDPGSEYPRGIFDSPRAIHQFYADLPDDTAALVDQIYERAAKQDMKSYLAYHPAGGAEDQLEQEPWARDVRAFAVIRTLLELGAPPPQAQAKLYRALAEIPGVRDDGVIDAGRGGQVRAIRWDQDFDEATWPQGLEWDTDWDLNGRHQILISTETNRFRGVRILDPDISLDSRQVGLDIVFESAFVDGYGWRP